MKQGLKYTTFKDFLAREEATIQETVKVIIENKEYHINESLKKKIISILSESENIKRK